MPHNVASECLNLYNDVALCITLFLPGSGERGINKERMAGRDGGQESTVPAAQPPAAGRCREDTHTARQRRAGDCDAGARGPRLKCVPLNHLLVSWRSNN